MIFYSAGFGYLYLMYNDVNVCLERKKQATIQSALQLDIPNLLACTLTVVLVNLALVKIFLALLEWGECALERT